MKTEIERMNMLCGGENPVCEVELGEDTLKSVSSRADGSVNEKEISYSHLKGFRETKHLIVLFLDGRVMVPLDKNGFESGDAEVCKRFLNSKIRRVH